MRLFLEGMIIAAGLTMAVIPAYASKSTENIETEAESTEIESESAQSPSEELIDILINPYVEKIRAYNQENEVGFTIPYKWGFWYTNCDNKAEEYEKVLESLADVIPESEEMTESETLPEELLTAPEFDESADSLENELAELLVPYERAIVNVNRETGSSFKIEDEYVWEAFYYFADYTQDETEDYLKEEYDKNAEKDTSADFIENLVKDVQDSRDEELKPYLEAIAQVEDETGIEILYSDNEQWVMAVTLRDFTPEEFAEYLTEQLDAGIVQLEIAE